MITDIKQIFHAVFQELCVGGFSVGVDFVDCEPHYAHSTYAQPWIDRYVKKGYLRRDPTILFAHQSPGHRTWKQLSKLYPTSELFNDAKKFGLTDGNTLSFWHEGRISIVSAAGPEWSGNDLNLARSALAGIHFLKLRPEKAANTGKLYAPVVQLMAQGYRDQEIANRLNIKLETVRQRRNKAYEETGTKTIANLVSEMIKRGLI